MQCSSLDYAVSAVSEKRQYDFYRHNPESRKEEKRTRQTAAEGKKDGNWIPKAVCESSSL
jgi:hypothetical protein